MYYKSTPNPRCRVFKLNNFSFNVDSVCISRNQRSLLYPGSFARVIIDTHWAIKEVLFSADVFSVLVEDELLWDSIVDHMHPRVDVFLSEHRLFKTINIESVDSDKSSTIKRMNNVVRPMLDKTISSHGGDVQIVDIADGVVMLKLFGACNGCGFATAEFKQSVILAFTIAFNREKIKFNSFVFI